MKPFYFLDQEYYDYYLFTDEEKDFMYFAARPLFAAFNSGEGVSMTKTLKKLMLDYNPESSSINFPTHFSYLTDMVYFICKYLRPTPTTLDPADDRKEKFKKLDRPAPLIVILRMGNRKGKSECIDHDAGLKKKSTNLDDDTGGKGKSQEDVDYCRGRRKRKSVDDGGEERGRRKRKSPAIGPEPPPIVEDGNGGRRRAEENIQENIEVIEEGNVGGGERQVEEGENIGIVEEGNGEANIGNNVPVPIICRKLHKSDMSDQQQRLSMPCNQVVSMPSLFLTAAEMEILGRKEKVPITVVDPAGRRHDAHLRWTAAGPKTHSYAIGKPWNTIRKMNVFREGMEIKIGALRGVENKLMIVLEHNDE